MNTLSVAFKNLKKNFSFYALYMLSVTLVITIYFAFQSFSVNHVMLEKISKDGRVESMCNIISVFLVVFVVFYMSYSNRFFLRRRTRELGIYVLLGYRKSAILRLLTAENCFIGAGALAAGLVLGAVMHKGIVYGTTMLLNLSIDHSAIPYFNFTAVMNTVLFILVVILVMAVCNARFLSKSSLMELVRYEKSAEKTMKFKKTPAISGLVLTAAGYALALDILRGPDSFWISFGFYPAGLLTAALVVSGTILFIASFLPYAAQNSKKNKRSFYTEIRMITVPNFIYRIRSNAKTLIMLTLLSAATLTVSSVMALSLYYPIAAVARIAPSELEFRIENEGQTDGIRKIISRYGQENSVIFTRTDIFKITASGERLPMEYSVGTSKGDSKNENILRTEGFECISYSQYISLLQAQGRRDVVDQMPRLQDQECILVKYQPNADGSEETGSIYSFHINGRSIPLTVRETTLDNAVSFANSVGTVVVSDQVCEQIESGGAPKVSILSINGEAAEDHEKLYEEINDWLGHTPYLQGYSHRVNEIISESSSTFLLIGFLVVLFFTATGSILYFHNISMAADSKADYEILSKMGYSDKMLKRIVRKQVLTFFCIPFLFGLTDCIFAAIVYKTGLMQNLLENHAALYIPAMIAAALTALIYFVYYCITVHTCCKTIQKS